MSRSPLAYPLNRGADMDVGGAADLQTDVMRFMAIISLCLVAIFALVQSMPIAPPVAPDTTEEQVTEEQVVVPEQVVVQEQVVVEEQVAVEEQVVAVAMKPTPAAPISLTRPKWTPKYQPKPTPQVAQAPPPATTPVAEVSVDAPAPPVEEQDGFTLRFESDAALTRLVAAGQVGVYAIDAGSARRMTVSDSRISFWDASVPNSFHEMEVSTVPRPVVDALTRSGVDTSAVSWGVTLPGKLKTQLDGLMQQQRGGSLLIGINGQIRLEDS
jgi:hypothetical protein